MPGHSTCGSLDPTGLPQLLGNASALVASVLQAGFIGCYESRSIPESGGWWSTTLHGVRRSSPPGAGGRRLSSLPKALKWPLPLEWSHGDAWQCAVWVVRRAGGPWLMNGQQSRFGFGLHPVGIQPAFVRRIRLVESSNLGERWSGSSRFSAFGGPAFPKVQSLLERVVLGLLGLAVRGPSSNTSVSRLVSLVNTFRVIPQRKKGAAVVSRDALSEPPQTWQSRPTTTWPAYSSRAAAHS